MQGEYEPTGMTAAETAARYAQGPMMSWTGERAVTTHPWRAPPEATEAPYTPHEVHELGVEHGAALNGQAEAYLTQLATDGPMPNALYAAGMLQGMAAKAGLAELGGSWLPAAERVARALEGKNGQQAEQHFVMAQRGALDRITGVLRFNAGMLEARLEGRSGEPLQDPRHL